MRDIGDSKKSSADQITFEQAISQLEELIPDQLPNGIDLECTFAQYQSSTVGNNAVVNFERRPPRDIITFLNTYLRPGEDMETSVQYESRQNPETGMEKRHLLLRKEKVVSCGDQKEIVGLHTKAFLEYVVQPE